MRPADDEFGIPRNDGFVDSIESGSYREQLIAVRDKIVNELTVHKCERCTALQLRTGDTAALILRLTTILEQIETLPAPEEVSQLEMIRKRRPTDGSHVTAFTLESGA